MQIQNIDWGILMEENNKKLKTTADFSNKLNDEEAFQDYNENINFCLKELVDEVDMLGRAIASYREAPHSYGPFEPITEIEARAIDAIGNNKSIGILELSEKLRRTKGAVSMILGRLEKKGFLNRVTCEDDHRRFELILTDSGKVICKEHKEYIQSYYKELSLKFSNYTLDDLLLCKNIIKKIRLDWE